MVKFVLDARHNFRKKITIKFWRLREVKHYSKVPPAQAFGRIQAINRRPVSCFKRFSVLRNKIFQELWKGKANNKFTTVECSGHWKMLPNTKRFLHKV